MRRPFVDKAVIDLVADHHQVPSDGDLGERLAGRFVEGGPRWVCWVAQEERLGSHRGCIHRVSVEAPVIARACRHRNSGATRKDDRREVGNVGRLWQHDAVTRTDDAAHGKVDRLRGADRDDDLALGIVGDA